MGITSIYVILVKGPLLVDGPKIVIYFFWRGDPPRPLKAGLIQVFKTSIRN